MKKVKCFSIVLFFIFLVSCSFVGSKFPLGNKNYILKADEWEGIWKNKNDESFFFIKLDKKKKNLLKIIAINNENEKLESMKLKVYILKANNFLFLNVLKSELDDKKDKNNKENNDIYLWLLVRKMKNRLELYSPYEQVFKDAIKEGKLKGEIKNDVIVIKSSQNEILDFINKKGVFEIFDKNEILNLKRIYKLKAN